MGPRLLAAMLLVAVSTAACTVDRQTGQRSLEGAAVGAAGGAAVGLLSGGLVSSTFTGAVAGTVGGFVYDQLTRR